MSKLDKDLQRQIALFRYGVIADLVHLPRGHRGIGARLKATAALTYAIPGTDRDRLAATTIRGWLTSYRAGGFEALYPKRRGRKASGTPWRRPPCIGCWSAPGRLSRRAAQPRGGTGAASPTAKRASCGWPTSCTGRKSGSVASGERRT